MVHEVALMVRPVLVIFSPQLLEKVCSPMLSFLQVILLDLFLDVLATRISTRNIIGRRIARPEGTYSKKCAVGVWCIWIQLRQ